VETVLARHPQIAEAAVVPAISSRGATQLVAHVEAGGVPDSGDELGDDELRDHVRGLLPAYLVPTALVRHERVHDGQGDHVFELLQLAENECPVGPAAGERYVEMIPVRFGLEPGRPVRRHPVTDGGDLPDEATRRGLCVIPLVVPLAID
jgi:hypothetical protein